MNAGLGSQPHTSDDGNERESGRMWTSIAPSTNPMTPGTWTLAWRSSSMSAPAFWYGYESQVTALAEADALHSGRRYEAGYARKGRSAPVRCATCGHSARDHDPDGVCWGLRTEEPDGCRLRCRSFVPWAGGKETSSQVDKVTRAREGLSSRDVARLLSWAGQVELAASRQVERLPGRGDTGVETALMYLRRVQTVAGDLGKWLRVGLESEPVPLLIEGRVESEQDEDDERRAYEQAEDDYRDQLHGDMNARGV